MVETLTVSLSPPFGWVKTLKQCGWERKAGVAWAKMAPKYHSSSTHPPSYAIPLALLLQQVPCLLQQCTTIHSLSSHPPNHRVYFSQLALMGHRECVGPAMLSPQYGGDTHCQSLSFWLMSPTAPIAESVYGSVDDDSEELAWTFERLAVKLKHFLHLLPGGISEWAA